MYTIIYITKLLAYILHSYNFLELLKGNEFNSNIRRKRFQDDGKVGSNRNMFPHLDNNCTDRISLITILEFWNPAGGLQLTGEELDDKIQPISGLSTVAATHYPIPRYMVDSCILILEAYTQLWKLEWVKRTLSSKQESVL